MNCRNLILLYCKHRLFSPFLLFISSFPICSSLHFLHLCHFVSSPLFSTYLFPWSSVLFLFPLSQLVRIPLNLPFFSLFSFLVPPIRLHICLSSYLFHIPVFLSFSFLYHSLPTLHSSFLSLSCSFHILISPSCPLPVYPHLCLPLLDTHRIFFFCLPVSLSLSLSLSLSVFLFSNLCSTLIFVTKILPRFTIHFPLPMRRDL